MEYTVEETTQTWRVNRFWIKLSENRPVRGLANFQHCNKRGQPVWYATREAAEDKVARLRRYPNG